MFFILLNNHKHQLTALMVASLISPSVCKLPHTTVAALSEAWNILHYLQWSDTDLCYLDIPERAYE